VSQEINSWVFLWKKFFSQSFLTQDIVNRLNINIEKDFFNKVVYSAWDNNKNYQIASVISKQYSFFQPVHASQKTALVLWNYQWLYKDNEKIYNFPSLIIYGTWNITESWTYFVVNNGLNLPFIDSTKDIENFTPTNELLWWKSLTWIINPCSKSSFLENKSLYEESLWKSIDVIWEHIFWTQYYSQNEVILSKCSQEIIDKLLIHSCPWNYTPINRKTSVIKDQLLENITDYIWCKITGKSWYIAWYTYSWSLNQSDKMILLLQENNEFWTWVLRWTQNDTLVSDLPVIQSTTVSTWAYEFWDGSRSTDLILNYIWLDSWNFAAKSCKNKTEGGQKWYLPAVQEIGQIYCYASWSNTSDWYYWSISSWSRCVSYGFLSSRIWILPVLEYSYRTSTQHSASAWVLYNFTNGARTSTSKRYANHQFICVSRF
jgi:hypothetical protein